MPDQSMKNKEGKKDKRENLRMWKPGQSGNPKGRPKKEICIPDILNTIGKEIPDNQILRNKFPQKTNLEIILQRVYHEALSGKPWAVQFIADRTEGKPRQPIEIDKPEPITIIKDEW